MTTRLPVKKRGGGGGGGGSEPPAHPLVRAIEQLYAAGATPRLVIDARRADVMVPDFVRAKWAERLVIDLDAAYPLDLVYDDAGVHVSLAFSGVVSRCTFAWPSIYRILDRADGRGIVVPAHEPPATLPPELAYGESEPKVVTEIVEGKKPSLSVVPPPADAPKPRAEAKTPVVEPKPDEPKAPAAASSSDEEAKARRAKFRVIEGG